MDKRERIKMTNESTMPPRFSVSGRLVGGEGREAMPLPHLPADIWGEVACMGIELHWRRWKMGQFCLERRWATVWKLAPFSQKSRDVFAVPHPLPSQHGDRPKPQCLALECIPKGQQARCARLFLDFLFLWEDNTSFADQERDKERSHFRIRLLQSFFFLSLKHIGLIKP